MLVKLIGKRERKAAIELSTDDLLLLVGGAKRRLANPDRTPAEHQVAAEALGLLQAELLAALKAEGFADPHFIVECLTPNVNATLDALSELHLKRKELRDSPTAYFSSGALRFVPDQTAEYKWPSDGNAEQ